jgi:hypothetical protein
MKGEGWAKAPEVSEHGRVRTLRVANAGAKAVLIMDGEEVDATLVHLVACAIEGRGRICPVRLVNRREQLAELDRETGQERGVQHVVVLGAHGGPAPAHLLRRSPSEGAAVVAGRRW